MHDTERLEHLIAHYMGKKVDLSPEAFDAERSELTRSVLLDVGMASLGGDAAAARLLLDLKILKR